MTEFKISDNVVIKCQSASDRISFHHLVKLFVDGVEIKKVRVQYYNRTWERFTFESAIGLLADRIRRNNKELAEKIDNFISNY